MNDLEAAYEGLSPSPPLIIQRRHTALMWKNGPHDYWTIGTGSRFGYRRPIGTYRFAEAIKKLKQMGFGGVYKKVGRSRQGWSFVRFTEEKNWRAIYNTRLR